MEITRLFAWIWFYVIMDPPFRCTCTCGKKRTRSHIKMLCHLLNTSPDLSNEYVFVLSFCYINSKRNRYMDRPQLQTSQRGSKCKTLIWIHRQTDLLIVNYCSVHTTTVINGRYLLPHITNITSTAQYILYFLDVERQGKLLRIHPSFWAHVCASIVVMEQKDLRQIFTSPETLSKINIKSN